MDTMTGIAWTMLGAVFLGTFALPSKYIKNYAWENTWGAFFLFGMLLVPVGFAAVVVKGLWAGYADVSGTAIFGVMALGFLWGCGFCCWGYGLSMLGLSIGYSLTMGTMALVGSMVPFFLGSAEKAGTLGGGIVIAGILICICGVGINGYAGMQREKSQAAGETEGEPKKKKNVLLGLVICVLAGVLSSGLNIAFHIGNNVNVYQFSVELDLQRDLENGRLSNRFRQEFQDHGISLSANIEITREDESGPWRIKDVETDQTYFAQRTDRALDIYLRGIAAVSKKLDNPAWIAGLSIWTLIFLGGMISSVGFSLILLCKNESWKGFGNVGSGRNLIFAALMAIGHFLCIFFYGVGTWKLGTLGTSVGFSIFQSGSLLLGNGLGFLTGEWKGASTKSRGWLFYGLAVLILGIVVVSIGNAVSS